MLSEQQKVTQKCPLLAGKGSIQTLHVPSVTIHDGLHREGKRKQLEKRGRGALVGPVLPSITQLPSQPGSEPWCFR